MPVWISVALQVAQVLAVVFSGAVALWVYLRSRNDEAQKELRKAVDNCAADVVGLADGVSKLRERLTVAERTINDGPSHRDLEGLRGQISNMSGHISALDERSKSTHSAVVRIETFLLESKR